MRTGISDHPRSFSDEVAAVLGIPKACARILEVVAAGGRKLSFWEISERASMSERSLRSHLGILVKKGILLREVAVTRTRRLAYRYYAAPFCQILGLARSEMAGRIERLKRLSAEVPTGRRPAVS